MNQAQVESYLKGVVNAVPVLCGTKGESSLSSWINHPVDESKWLLMSEYQKKFGKKRIERKLKVNEHQVRTGQPRRILYKGRVFESINSAAAYWGIPSSTIRTQLYRAGRNIA